MIIGVPREVKDHEARVGLVPSGAAALVEAGHRVLVETEAGSRSSLPDDEYRKAGAEIVPAAAEAWKADLVVKVKEPQQSEYEFLRPGLLLFTYLHLAPLPELTDSCASPGLAIGRIGVTRRSRVNCSQLDPGAVIRPEPSEWHPRMPDRLDEDELTDWRSGRDAIY